ncbi:MAG: nusB [Rickettsiaceae bacterium]|jgi:N utilization substance protein B|nr:nusB [Rickettsiaceae bacterium]
MVEQQENIATGRRTNTRLAAVKALYASEINHKINEKKTPAELTLDIIAYYHEIDKDTKTQLDESFLASIVKGVCENIQDLDKSINRHIGTGWSLERLGPVMRSILRSAVFELMSFDDTPLKVIINEYVNITRGFFDDKEVGFVNGILDKIGHEVRGE